VDLITETDWRIIGFGVLTSQQFGQRLRTMTPTWIGRIGILFLALTAQAVRHFSLASRAKDTRQ
jgi:hypothetical protein